VTFNLGIVYNAPTATVTILAPVTTKQVTNAGTADLGTFNGQVQVNGSFTQLSTGTLELHIRGYTPMTGYSVLDVTGTVTLDGTLLATLDNGFQPIEGSTFDVIDATGGISLAPTLSYDLPTGFTYQLIDNNTILQLTSNEEYDNPTPFVTPEPSTVTLLVGGMGLLAFWQIRRRRA
jgi:hypothetical protein